MSRPSGAARPNRTAPRSVGRARAPDRRGHEPDRTPQRFRVLSRLRRRAVRGHNRLRLAPARRFDGQPPHLTASMIDSREFLAARRRAETQVLAPAGPRSPSPAAPTATITTHLGPLDKVRAKHPDMVLLHGGSPRGAERIAACWADNRKVRRSSSSPTGPATATLRPSSATTRCSRPCRSASSSSRAPASPPTSPTRPGSSASRSWRVPQPTGAGERSARRPSAPPRRPLALHIVDRVDVISPHGPSGRQFLMPGPLSPAWRRHFVSLQGCRRPRTGSFRGR